jgi:hypothetical protein
LLALFVVGLAAAPAVGDAPAGDAPDSGHAPAKAETPRRPAAVAVRPDWTNAPQGVRVLPRLGTTMSVPPFGKREEKNKEKRTPH